MANPTGKGGFRPGQSGNSAGRTATGWQSFRDRLCFWLETKTVAEVEELVSNKKAWGKLSMIDALLAMRLHEAAKEGGTHDFNAILDRYLGKPTQEITAGNVPLQQSYDLHELARRTAFLFSVSKLAAPTIIEQKVSEQDTIQVITPKSE